MDDFREFFPEAPNFGALSALAPPIAIVLAVGLAAAAIIFLIALVFNLLKMAIATIKDNPSDLRSAKSSAGTAAIWLLVLVVCWSLVVGLFFDVAELLDDGETDEDAEAAIVELLNDEELSELLVFHNTLV